MNILKKIKYTRVFILGVFVYILFKAIIILIGENTSNLLLENNTYTLKKKVDALVIRDEYLIKSDTDGTLSLSVGENEKIHKSQELATIYNNKINGNINKEIQRLKEDIKSIEKENSSLKRGILYSKKEQLDILQEKVKSNTSTYYAESPGVLSFKYDEYSNVYTPDSLENITKEDIKNTKNSFIQTKGNNEHVKEGDVIFRVINNNEIYMVFANDDKKLFNEGDSVKIEINKKQINGEIYKVYKKDDYFLTTIKITQQNIGIFDTRHEEFDIIYRQMEALRIPKDSIVKHDKKRGAYVINEETKKPEFTEIKGNYYEDDNYIYMDFRTNKANGVDTIDLYDRIVLKPNFINKRIKIFN